MDTRGQRITTHLDRIVYHETTSEPNWPSGRTCRVFSIHTSRVRSGLWVTTWPPWISPSRGIATQPWFPVRKLTIDTNTATVRFLQAVDRFDFVS